MKGIYALALARPVLWLCVLLPMGLSAQSRFKRIQYEYDLISGNVKQVHYQAGEPDQLHHRYSYDADNRITKVQTSRNDIDYREDAQYFYYPHGPLQRVELGQNKVQGVDYAYTLQGWLKGINGNELTPELDMGLDAAQVQDNANMNIGRDVCGLSLGYYGDNDYMAIDPAKNTPTTRPFAPIGLTGTLHDEQKPLYNGNITHTVNSLAPFGGYPEDPVAPGQVLAMVYRYDQLNRLKKARAVLGDNIVANTWDNLMDNGTNRYRSDYVYDANGNITNTERYDKAGSKYDSLSYYYHVTDIDPGTPVVRKLLRNRLYQVKELADTPDDLANDVVDLPRLPNGITDEFNTGQTINSANNYRYDELGNLIKDANEHIASITWSVAGKVKAVDQATGSGKKDLVFTYGAGGQRISKSVYDDAGTTLLYRDHYIRDAQGNVMAVYRHTEDPFSLKVMERPLYGSSRLGTDAYELELAGDPPYEPALDPPGQLRYELADHLGNVPSVLTDELLPVDVNNDDVPEYFQPHVLSASGYEPFGALLPGRNYSSSNYRFGFNGQEKDDEVFGATGASMTAEFWQYDTRTGRRWNLDPVSKPWQSSYSTFSGNPIARIDPKGDDDYFNADGTFSHRTKTGQNIIIKTAAGDVKFSAMRTNNMHNRQVMANVVGHYARQVGIDGTVGVANHSTKNSTGKDGAMAFTAGYAIYVNARGGGVNSKLDDYRNMKSTLTHERIHKERGEGFENLDADPAFESYRHASVYLAQMQDPTFKDAPFKSGMIGLAVDYLNRAAGEMKKDYDPATELSGIIGEFNKLSDVTGYKLNMSVSGSGNNPKMYSYKVTATSIAPSKSKKQ